MRFNRAIAQEIQSYLNVKLNNMDHDLDLPFDLRFGITPKGYNDDTVRFTVDITAREKKVSALGNFLDKSNEIKDKKDEMHYMMFMENCALYGLIAEDFKRIAFNYENEPMKLVYFKPRNHKYPLIFERVKDKKLYKYPRSLLQKLEARV